MLDGKPLKVSNDNLIFYKYKTHENKYLKRLSGKMGLYWFQLFLL